MPLFNKKDKEADLFRIRKEMAGREFKDAVSGNRGAAASMLLGRNQVPFPEGLTMVPLTIAPVGAAAGIGQAASQLDDIAGRQRPINMSQMELQQAAQQASRQTALQRFLEFLSKRQAAR